MYLWPAATNVVAAGHILNKVWGIDELRILLATVQIQLWTWGRWRKWRELAMDGQLALEGKGRPTWSVSIFE